MTPYFHEQSLVVISEDVRLQRVGILQDMFVKMCTNDNLAIKKNKHEAN